MANRIYVLCRSSKPISFQEISEQIQDLGFLDKPVRLDASLDRANEDWRAFEVHRDDIEPLTFEQLRDPVERSASFAKSSNARTNPMLRSPFSSGSTRFTVGC